MGQQPETGVGGHGRQGVGHQPRSQPVVEQEDRLAIGGAAVLGSQDAAVGQPYLVVADGHEASSVAACARTGVVDERLRLATRRSLPGHGALRLVSGAGSGSVPRV
jgi:hypothetical protein